MKPDVETTGDTIIAWGGHPAVSPEFKAKVLAIAARLGCDPSDLMSCMAFESACTFSSSKRNAAGSGATGLIQFMPSTARNLGTTTTAMAEMTPEAQLDYVERYFAPYRSRGLGTIEDLYMAILWPAAIGKPLDFVLFRGPSGQAYRQNAGLDRNHDGVVTKDEAAGLVRATRERGWREFPG